jgi:hypothetical protein
LSRASRVRERRQFASRHRARRAAAGEARVALQRDADVTKPGSLRQLLDESRIERRCLVDIAACWALRGPHDDDPLL